MIFIIFPCFKIILKWKFFDFYNIKPKSNHIKMGTISKAYGSYGAYILASKEIISFLENRAKSIIYATAPSLFDIVLAYFNVKYIIKTYQDVHPDTELSKKLGISRKSRWEKRKKYGLTKKK